VEYDKYIKPTMDKLTPKFKYLTQVNDSCWLIQSSPDSMMEAYTVHTTNNGHIIMTGDYDGVMVRPYGNEDRLPNWMAGATTISYFAEKVHSANRYHKCEEYSEAVAENNIKQIREGYLENASDEDDKNDRAEKFDRIVECNSLEMEYEYWVLLRELEHELDLYDLYEYSPMTYTHQFKWQHECLLFWANKVLEGEFTRRKE
jgi:hypothetical protein